MLACLSAGYVTVKIANHLMGISSLDVASLASEIQREEHLNFHAPEHEASDSVRLEFLLIRSGIVSEIAPESLEFVPASKHPISHITFDGPYSNRLNILAQEDPKREPIAPCALLREALRQATLSTHSCILQRP